MSILPLSSQTMRSSLAAYLPRSAHRRQLSDSCADGDVLTATRFDDCSKSAHCANQYRTTDVDQLFATYDAVLRDIADKLAPAHSIRRRPGRPTPWFDAECRTERRQCRRLERHYRRTCSVADRRDWVDATRRRLRLYKLKNEQYWLDRLDQCGRSSSQLWRSFSPLLGCDRDVAGATDHTPENFAEFFEKKVNDVRATTPGPLPSSLSIAAFSSLTSFEPCSQTEVRRIILQSPVKSCSLDPAPTFLVRVCRPDAAVHDDDGQ